MAEGCGVEVVMRLRGRLGQAHATPLVDDATAALASPLQHRSREEEQQEENISATGRALVWQCCGLLVSSANVCPIIHSAESSKEPRLCSTKGQSIVLVQGFGFCKGQKNGCFQGRAEEVSSGNRRQIRGGKLAELLARELGPSEIPLQAIEERRARRIVNRQWIDQEVKEKRTSFQSI